MMNKETFMRAGQKEMPVYLFTGFLDSGKTTFIQGTLEDPAFNNGEKTLLLLCEEGEEEFNPAKFAFNNVEIVVIEDEEELDTGYLAGLAAKYDADRVIVEYNGMWMLDSFYSNMPANWVVYQEMCLTDATTFLTYNANMRNLVYDKMKSVETIVFKKFTRDMDKMEYHKIVRAASRRAEILYEFGENEVEFDNIEDPLPFDIEADVIEISDEDYAIWYRDMSEDMEKYDGKTVKFKGIVARDIKLGKDALVIGRHVMTCCVEDIAYQGLVCKFKSNVPYKTRDWIIVQGRIQIEKNKLYGKPGPVIYAEASVNTGKPEKEVATFY